MSKYIAKFNAANLLEQLSSKGFVIDEEFSDFVINQHQKKELPLYLRALVGISAFIASLCFIGFLRVTYIISFQHKEGLIIWGLIFIASAIGLQRVAGHNNTVKHSFLIQASFASMVIGKTLFLFGIDNILDFRWGITLGLLIVTGITYHIYRMSIDRFLSSFAVLFSILVNIFWDRDGSGSRELILNGFFLFQFAGAAILLVYSKIKCDYIPLSYAFTFSLCASILFLISYTEFDYWGHKELINPAFINIMLTFGLITLFGWTAGGIEKLKTAPLLLASICTVLLGFISVPGILLTIVLMVLGYAKHDELLIITGALFLPIFLFLYYYNLDVSLLKKSGILIGSGVLLLVGRFYLQRKIWNERGLSCVQK